MAVCNETGAVLPINECAKIAKEKSKGIFVHVDGVQAFMKVPLSLENIDFLSISAHKIGGVKGIGGLYIAENIKMLPWLYGGYQDLGLRSGTQAVPQIYAFKEAVAYHRENLTENTAHMTEIRDYLIENLEKASSQVVKPSNMAPHIVNVGFLKGRSEVIIRVLSDKGIYIAGGIKCSYRLKKINLHRNKITYNIKVIGNF